MFRNRQKYALLTVMVLGAVTLAGCMGQKYGFPGFGTKPASKTEVKTPSVQEPAQVTKDDELNHVAQSPTIDNPPGIVPASANLERSNAPAGKVRISDLPQNNSVRGVDQAFQEKQVTAPVARAEEVSSLRALKASLDQISNQDAAQRTSQEQSRGELSLSVSDNKKNSSETVGNPSTANEDFGIAILSEKDEKTDQSHDFPWAKSGKKSEQESSQEQAHKNSYGLDPIRGMLKKTRVLIQQNNLLDARVLAETAHLLKKKTEAVFSSEEVTPEQILAEIAERERQRKDKLLANYRLEGQSTNSDDESSQGSKLQKRYHAPVVIDLSRDWINTELKGRDDQFNDVAAFEQSISRSGTTLPVQANQGARLPMIQPGYQRSDMTSGDQHIDRTSLDSTNRLSVPDSAPVLSAPDLKQQQHSSVEHTSYLPPELPFDEEPTRVQPGGQNRSSRQSNNTPLLIAPGINSEQGHQKNSQFDQFADNFNGMEVVDASEIEQAPLLIDEAELQVQAHSSQLSTTMLSLIVCGIAFTSFLFIRWRR